MKNNILKIFTLLLLFSTQITTAQVISAGSVVPGLGNTNYFIDASTFQGKLNVSEGKIMGFPKTDLTSFIFNLSPIDNDIIAPNYFDGVLVYNSATGTTIADQGKTVSVTPGFYYFSNPKGTSVKSGQWIRVGGEGNVVNNNTNVETITNNTFDGAPIYSFKTTFVATGDITKYTLTNAPAGVSSIYKVTIYNANKSIFTNSVYSYNPATKQLVTGSPYISVVYPADTYNVVFEYLK